MNSPAINARWWRAPAVRIGVKASIGLSLLALLCLRLDLHAVLTAFYRFSWPYMLVALVLFVVSWTISAQRWRLLAPNFPYRYLLELTLIGQFYAIVLPGQIAGEAVKAYRIAKGKTDAERLALSVAMDRLIGTIALIVVAGIGLALTPHELPSVMRPALVGMSALLIGALFVFRIPAIFVLAQKAIVRATPSRVRRFIPMLQRLMDAWRGFSQMPLRLLGSLLLGVVVQLLATAIYLTLATHLGIFVPVEDWCWIVAVVAIAVLLPISIGGIGLREGALVGCLRFLGVPAEPALALSLGIFALMLVGAVCGGILELVGNSHWRGRLDGNPIDDDS